MFAVLRESHTFYVFLGCEPDVSHDRIGPPSVVASYSARTDGGR